MKRHELTFIKCGHIPAKADNDKQHQWVETELKPVMEAAQKEEVHLFFFDSAHFVLQPFLCSLWCAFRGFIKASVGRNRINVLGAVNAIAKEVITITNTTYITSGTLIDFLKLLKEKNMPINLLQCIRPANYLSLQFRHKVFISKVSSYEAVSHLFY